MRLRAPALMSVIALLLAVLLPFEAAHCAWMGVPARGATKSTLHACCAKAMAQAASHAAKRLPIEGELACCKQLPSGVLAAHVAVPAPDAALLATALLAPLSAPAPSHLPRIAPQAEDPPGAPPLASCGLRGPPARS